MSIFYYQIRSKNNTPDVGNQEPSGGWETLATMPVPLFREWAIGYNGKLYTGAGFYPGGGSIGTYEYDPATDTWATLASSSGISTGPGKAVIYDDKIYVWGCFADNTVGVFTPPTVGTPSGSWRYIDPVTKPPNLNYLNVWEVSGDTIIMQGGSQLTRVWTLDLISETWTDTGVDLVTDNQGMASAMYGDKIYMFGGTDSGAPHHSTFIDVSALPTITVGATASEFALKPASTGASQRYYNGSVVIGNQIYVGGGEQVGHSSTYLSRYSVDTDSWEANIEVDTGVFGLPIGIGQCTLAYLDDYLYLVGGYNGSILDSLYRVSMV